MDQEGAARPDRILAAVEASEGRERAGEETGRGHRGHLRIFFGYAAGVGKTYAMLEAAQEARRRGVDVVAGYIEPHARPDTSALARGLEALPPRRVEQGGMARAELDLDAAIERTPQVLLVDELAHTCAAGSRHAKRYQDVEEVLGHGIDVYTTLNVQHIESLNDTVAAITGVVVRERIPDRVFDEADQVELVDIEPEELLERLRSGSVYRAEQAERALENFFTLENLTALREIALRRCADRTSRLVNAARVLSNRSFRTSEHILVCVSPSPTCPRIIRAAAHMAVPVSATFSALYVETPKGQDMEDADRERLRANMELARRLGAQVETVYGDDPAFQIAEYARLSGVSEIVMGRNTDALGGRWRPGGRHTLVDRLVSLSPDLDVHIIPDREPSPSERRERARTRLKRDARGDLSPSSKDLLITGALLAASTAIGVAFQRMGFADSAIISLYVLATVLTAVGTTRRACTLVSSVLSVLAYNFFFVIPVGTFDSIDSSYLVTFAIMFITALAAAELTGRISRSARSAARTAYRTRILLDTSQLMQGASTPRETAEITLRQLKKLLARDVVFYPSEKGRLGRPILTEVEGEGLRRELCGDRERAVASWVLANNKRAGATTGTLGQARCLYLAVRAGQQVFGVVGIVMGGEPLEAFEYSIVLSIVGACALSLAREQEARERQEEAVKAKNEQLRADLLRSIGHDLRTPLTSILGSASILAEEPGLEEERRAELARDIEDDALWLVDTVENLLAVTRMEEGNLRLNHTVELVDDVLDDAAERMKEHLDGHELVVEPAEELLLARVDAGLVVQLVTNLISNAVKYTPQGTRIKVSARKKGGMALVEVADEGPGVPDAEKGRIFERFYSGGGTTAPAGADGGEKVARRRPADALRSFGLGLALCRAIAEAHGGTIDVRDNEPRGAVFYFTLPLEEVQIHG